MARLRQFLRALWETRVLNPHDPVAKVSQLGLVLDIYGIVQHDRFRRNLRVIPSTFGALLAMIETNPLFISTGIRPQFPIHHQLAITLFRIGHFGNAASVASIAQWAGCSEGAVVNSTRRVFIAIMGLHDAAIRRPTRMEKEAAKQWTEEQSCHAWRNGYCMVDGTVVPLAAKPGFHGEAYFDRKSHYSLNVQVSQTSGARLIYILTLQFCLIGRQPPQSQNH